MLAIPSEGRNMAIIKHAARQTLGQLIGANNPVVTVPDDSQRQFAWTKKEVDTFWTDVEKFSKLRATGGEASSEYFIGPIVTITDEQVKTRALLDGQQRLTTSTILLSALRDALWGIGTAESRVQATNLQRDYIARKASRRQPMEYFLTLSRFDKAFFRDYIQNWDEAQGRPERVENPINPSHQLIIQARSNFDLKVAQKLTEIDGIENQLDWIEDFSNCLIDGLVFVEIQTPTSSDANEVFETINSRGKDLSTVDLVRNFLMAKSRDADEKERVNQAWDFLLQGFDKREEIERFLRHSWVARHGDVKAHSLYSTIRTNLEKRFEKKAQSYSARSFAAELQSDSERYMDLIAGTTGHAGLDSYLAEVKALGADALYPLLLAASQDNQYGDLQQLAQVALTYYVRWTVVGRRESTILEEVIFEAAKELSSGSRVESALARISDALPNDEAFQADLSNVSIAKSSQARYLLTKIERFMRQEKSVDEVEVAGSKIVHVDHIYPQHPPSEWILKDQPGDRPGEQHNRWVARLGNQTLLHGKKNQEASNRPYPEKSHLYEESLFQITKSTGIERVWDPSANFWRTDGIRERQAFLATLAVKIWPNGDSFS
ncbi:DUF262 domain-containing protein [Nonomuraea longispora]|uniref:DUF262 domain-containing protein n=2 Tax=Nonomuraea longispora TaxID=1848320 RepID=A0A4R4N3Z9_9ACTN|nr:DUF262 domain-containing protein [Nonomuraea longispora]